MELEGEFFELGLEAGDLSQSHVEFTTQLGAFWTAGDGSRFEIGHLEIESTIRPGNRKRVVTGLAK